MDKFIAEIKGVEDDDLMICEGVAYQRDMTVTARYDADYYNKCAGYEGQKIADQINAGRMAIVAKHYGDGRALDIGIGSGEFIKSRPDTMGYDVNPAAVEWLRNKGKWADQFSMFQAFTFWDVIEHVPEPDDYFQHIGVGGYLFTSIPVFSDLTKIRDSRHYRPGEHLYYWTASGFVEWMNKYGFLLLDCQTFEMDAGRDSIYSFAFVRESK